MFVAGLLPRVSSLDGVDVALCLPFTALAAIVESTRGSRVEVYAQNMHEAESGPYTGEISSPMLSELDVHGVAARPLRAPPGLRRDRPRAGAEGAGGARCGNRADAVRGGDRGGARGRRHRAQAAPPGPRGARPGCRRAARRGGHRLRADLGDRHRQGRHARPGPGGDRVRPRARRRPVAFGGRGVPDPLRRQRQAPTTPPSCSPCPTSTARSSAGRRWSRRSSPRSSPPPGR